MDLKNMRINYQKSEIDFQNLDDDPIKFFIKWFDDAVKTNKNEANACVLSTVSLDLKPSSRVVLLKGFSEKGFVFFTNYNSKKSADIEANNYVALNFYWPELERQVRVAGVANKILNIDSDNYFQSRPRSSQLGALISDQSSSIDLNFNFQNSLDSLESTLSREKIKRPLNWGGYCVKPDKVEFWQGRPSRFHDRILYKFNGCVWDRKRLAP
jgi:pyridoxamine 5'-phosphate oxidase